jgi:hypothetical protein
LVSFVGSLSFVGSASAQSLEQRILSSARGGVTWVGYREPMTGGPRHMCCYDSIGSAGDGVGMCRLESGSGVTMTNDSLQSRGNRIVIEAPTDFVVLARIENGAVTKLRTFTPDCDLDATGTTLVWLSNVSPDDSVAWLSTLVSRETSDRDSNKRVGNGALTALAVQAGDRAAAALIGFAKNHPSTHIRGQALFWLAQRAGQQALATIANAIDNDPETDVKKRAVFALSQLPKDEGVPKLIEVARTHRNPEVRKQAFFWLGQSKDPRALALFEEVLLKK